MSARPNANARNPEHQQGAVDSLWDGIVRSYSEACKAIVQRDEDGNLVHVNDTQRFVDNLNLADRGMQVLAQTDPREAMRLMNQFQTVLGPSLLDTILEIAP